VAPPLLPCGAGAASTLPLNPRHAVATQVASPARPAGGLGNTACQEEATQPLEPSIPLTETDVAEQEVPGR